MTDKGFQEASRTILDEITRALAQVDPGQVAGMEEAVLSAHAVFVVGAGRSGLVGRCFAMRLTHLGLRSHVIGETVTPAVGPGDLVIALSGSGETPTILATVTAAIQAGAQVVAVTAFAHSPLAEAAQAKLIISTGTEATGISSTQYGGSMFEQALMVMLETIALGLQNRLAETPDRMDRRHANLE